MSIGEAVTPGVTAAMCSASRILGDPRLSPDGTAVAFVSGRQGVTALVTVPVDGGPEVVITTEPAPTGSAPDGRGVFDWTPDGAALVYVTASGALHHQPVTGGPGRSLTGADGGGAAGPVVSPDGTRVAYVSAGRHVAVAWLDAAGPWPVRVSASPDFCVDPTWSRDGLGVAWHEWDIPAMAWDASHIAVATAPLACAADQAADPRAGQPSRRITLPLPDGVAVAQPRYSPDGSRLGFLCDANGWLNLWVADADGSDARPVIADDHEHGGPTWGGGQRSWAWAPDGRRVAVARNEGGFGRLILIDLATAEVVTVARGVFTGLSWRADRLVGVRSGAATPDQVVAYETGDLPAPFDPSAPFDPFSSDAPPRLLLPRITVARGPVAGFEAAGLCEPRLVTWEAEERPRVGKAVHGRLTEARSIPGDPGAPETSGATGGGRGAPPPLLVWVHGGPTGQSQVTFNARAAYFADRGWNLLHVDPRGSTGWGRAYAQALHQEWGRLDIDDIAAGIRAAFAAGWGDRDRTAIMGGSSGGLAVLGVLARHPELCAAGVDLYGVTDLIDLDDTTHRFEAHYQQSLIGLRPQADERYRERSPLHLADRITAPLLVLHGTADRSVLRGQSDALVESLRSRHAPVEYHLYEGEGHGWSRPETVRDELERIDAFLTRHVLRLPRSLIS
ncbi:MAG: prolyl oligopeptidase family serine peptidase [Actinomycetota bacterium]|nr:prolyl oligopeptidase family serine peptidase [Actinomycetota bacterium]